MSHPVSYSCRYIQQQLDDSEAELISDNSDLDLEPGEIPSTKTMRFSVKQPQRGGRHRRPVARTSVIINDDDYGSSSEGEGDYGSDESLE